MKIKYEIEFEEEVKSEDVTSLTEDRLALAKKYVDERVYDLILSQLSSTAINVKTYMELLEDEIND